MSVNQSARGRCACGSDGHDQPRCPQFVDTAGRQLQVRRYTPADYDQLLELYETFDSEDRAQGLPPATHSRLERWLERMIQEGVNFVAVHDGKVVGHSLYTPQDSETPELAVFVRRAYRGYKIGTELCKHIVATATATGKDAVVLEVERHNRAAICVYRNLGFETDGPARRNLSMRLSLSA